MSGNNEVTFEDAVEWADSCADVKKDKKKGTNVFYLVLGAIVMLILVILIIYLVGRDQDKIIESGEALAMMQNSDLMNVGDIIEETDPTTGETIQYEYVDDITGGVDGDITGGVDENGYEYEYEYVDPAPINATVPVSV